MLESKSNTNWSDINADLTCLLNNIKKDYGNCKTDMARLRIRLISRMWSSVFRS